MTMKRNKKKSNRQGSEYGLVRRVANRLSVSEQVVSMVKNGRTTSARISAALAEERLTMEMEGK